MRKFFFLGLLVSSFHTVFAASFRNLGFEEMNSIGLASGSMGPTSALLPGWGLTLDNEPAGEIGYNNDIAFDGRASVFDQFSTSYHASEGKVALGLNPLFGPFSQRWLDWSLAQKGDVPADAKSLLFRKQADGLFKVEIEGNPLTLVLQSAVYHADISTYAGKTWS